MKLAKQAIEYINKPKAMGEVWNLEKIKILENTPNPKTEIEKLITDFFFGDRVRDVIKNRGHFICLELEKKYLKKLHSMLNASTKETKLKRQKSIIQEFTSWRYNIMLSNREKLNKILHELNIL